MNLDMLLYFSLPYVFFLDPPLGTRVLPGRLYRTAVCPGCCTLVGLSAMFISVAFTTVYSVAPASRSLMKRAHIPDRVRRLPVLLPNQLRSSW